MLPICTSRSVRLNATANVPCPVGPRLRAISTVINAPHPTKMILPPVVRTTSTPNLRTGAPGSDGGVAVSAITVRDCGSSVSAPMPRQTVYLYVGRSAHPIYREQLHAVPPGFAYRIDHPDLQD